jgi:hypothetical protein
MPQYTLQFVPVGHNELPGWIGSAGSPTHVWETYTFYIVLIRGEGRLIAINSGPPTDLADLNAAMSPAGGDRTYVHVAPHERTLAALESVGVYPDEVDTLLLSPLVGYATGNVDLFRRAEICILRRGWTDFFAPTYRERNDIRRFADIPREQLTHLVTDAWPRVRLLEDEDTLAPGITTWFAGVHHRSSLATCISTSIGRVVYTDAFFFFRNREQRVPIGIAESVFEHLELEARLDRDADLVLPGFDGSILERFPSRIVGAESAASVHA